MAKKINPFRPNSPINPGMFVGRIPELDSLESSLIQTRAGQPKNFMVTGERGIGKTSMLDYVRALARGGISGDDSQMNFLVLSTDIAATTTQSTLIRKIEREFRRELAKSEQARDFLKSAWGFLQKVEFGGAKINEMSSEESELILDDFAYSVAQTTLRVSDPDQGKAVFGSSYDGVLLLLDECDQSSPELGLGSFLKLLLEKIQRHGCNRFMVGIAGLSNLRNVLFASHESSLRLFDELVIDRLNDSEVKSVVRICLDRANENNEEQTSISEEGIKFLVMLSEGYPHFIQQIGYCAFEEDSDNDISQDDVLQGAVGGSCQ